MSLLMPIFGMDRVKTQALISSQDDIPKIIMQAIEQGKFVFFDSYALTHKGISQQLSESQYMQGNVGRHSANQRILAELAQAQRPVQRFTDLHTKRVLLSEKDPRLGSPGKNIVFDMSGNLTYNAYHNLETAIKTEGDKDYFMQQFNDHQYVTRLNQYRSPARTKRIIMQTPQKRMVHNSRHYQLHASKALRIRKLLESTNENRSLYITSMNWLNQDVTNAIIDVCRDGVTTKVIVNGTALKTGKKQLDAMHAAGVAIYVFDPENKVRHAQHSKVLLRIDGSEALLINSTANMTAQGEKEINIDCYHPGNVQATETMRRALDQYADRKCIEYGKIK